MPTVNANASAHDVREILRRLPGILAGTAPDPWSILARVRKRMGDAMLAEVRKAFIEKSRGGTGSDGVKWKPLKATRGRQKRASGKGILFDSGKLLAGLRVVAGRIAVEATDKKWHHEGTGRIPSRPFWPLDGSCPEAWRKAVLAELKRAIADVVAELMQKGAKP